ncbi:hypothetical protein ElyMa_005532600 [Elysia marginata]|uniref:Uncharacterized protein n=1 Tax=Elysia marginata TaxID=1093978 RepID=A0AAV4EZ13_9GAST|nr:hypothetical protein ElyMa_005532600 [Elysia marginata]
MYLPLFLPIYVSINLSTHPSVYLDASNNDFGLTASLGKTEMLFQLAPNSNTLQPSLTIDGKDLKTVESFICRKGHFLATVPWTKRSRPRSAKQISRNRVNQSLPLSKSVATELTTTTSLFWK